MKNDIKSLCYKILEKLKYNNQQQLHNKQSKPDNKLISKNTHSLLTENLDVSKPLTTQQDEKCAVNKHTLIIPPRTKPLVATAFPNPAIGKVTTNLLLSPPPPSTFPEYFFEDYTQNGSIPIHYWYLDDSDKEYVGGRKSLARPHITRAQYETAFSQLDNGAFDYYRSEVCAILDALDDYSVKDKVVLVWGLASCNCEAISLWKGAKHIYVVDYNRPICEHENITVLTFDELSNTDIKADFAISYSTFEHDGLGRYGDPLDPNADLKAMQRAYDYLAEDGIMLLSVPIGKDVLFFNACRIYGEKRLPLLLHNWECIDVYSIYTDTPAYFESHPPEIRHIVFILKKKQLSNSKDFRNVHAKQSKGIYGTYDLPTKLLIDKFCKPT